METGYHDGCQCPNPFWESVGDDPKHRKTSARIMHVVRPAGFGFLANCLALSNVAVFPIQTGVEGSPLESKDGKAILDNTGVFRKRRLGDEPSLVSEKREEKGEETPKILGSWRLTLGVEPGSPPP